MTTVYIPGVWDLLHVGHVNVLQKAAALGDRLIVGVPTDAVVREDKGKDPIICDRHRLAMLNSLACVTSAAMYYQLEFLTHLDLFRPDILAVGETWGGARRHKDAESWMAAHGGRTVVLPYTKEISTTMIKQRVIEQHNEPI